MGNVDIIVIGIGDVHIAPCSNTDNPEVIICTDFKSKALRHDSDKAGLFT
jgi:hypothetical protein